MMEAYTTLGEMFCLIGGFVLLLWGIGFSAYWICVLWVEVSRRFRGILKGESLIWEYKKNREQFLKWKETMKK